MCRLLTLRRLITTRLVFQASFGCPAADSDAVGDAPRQPFTSPEDVASGRGQRFLGDVCIPGVSNGHGGVRSNEDP